MGQKKRKKQAELIQELTDQELVWNVVASQLIFLFLAAIASFFLFSWNELFGLFDFQWMEIFLYGLIPGTVVVIIDLLLIRFVPKKHWDDGGVNEKIFRSPKCWSNLFVGYCHWCIRRIPFSWRYSYRIRVYSSKFYFCSRSREILT